MTSQRSVIKLGAEKTLKPEEAKRCELKLPMEIKRAARICCVGRVQTRAITSHFRVTEERVSTPIRRSESIQGMKRKDYKEVSLKPKDYGGDYSDDRSLSSWAATEREDNELYYWEEVPKEKTPEGPNGGGNPNDGGDDDGGDDDGGDNTDNPGDVDPFGMHPLCCAACRHSIMGLYA
jgi:hypothetical protein